MNLLIIILSVLPVLAEILFDHSRWRKGKDDKPLSTYLRAGLFVVLAIIIAFLIPGTWWITAIAAGLYVFATHLLLFNPLLNLSRPKISLFYRKEGELWNAVPIYGEYFIKLVVLYSTWASLFHWSWVCCGEYPGKLVDYFMF